MKRAAEDYEREITVLHMLWAEDRHALRLLIENHNALRADYAETIARMETLAANYSDVQNQLNIRLDKVMSAEFRAFLYKRFPVPKL